MNNQGVIHQYELRFTKSTRICDRSPSARDRSRST